MKKMVIVIAALGLVLAAEAFVAFMNMPGPLLEETALTDSDTVQKTGASDASLDKINVIVDSPKSGEAISSPLKITGKVRGDWTFEANLPIVIVDWDGKIVGTGHGTVKGEWMTTSFVPFEATITYDRPANIKTGTFSEHGAIIFKKDNPSGLPQYDGAVEMPIIFK